MSAPALPAPPPTAFTIRHLGRVARLISEITIFPAHIQGQPAGKQYKALYDTGATNSAISAKIVADFQLPSIGARVVGVGSGKYETTVHLVHFGLPNRVMFQMVQAAQLVLGDDFDAIIGMDILGVGDFSVTHYDGNTTFSFCCPSLGEINFVEQIAQGQKIPQVVAPPSIGRNSQCPCRSGKKYKRCCGAK